MADFVPSHLPAFPVHPGLFLREELEARQMTAQDLAALTNRSLGEILAVVNERALIDQALADDIGRALDTGHEGWANGTTLYLMTLERDFRRDAVQEAISAAD